MIKRVLQFLAAVTLVATLWFTSTLASAAESPALMDLVDQALANNPELQAGQARWDAFVNKARQAGRLEDPMLMLRMQNLLVRDPLAFDREAMTAKVIGLSQTLPFFGKRALAREGAEREAESARWNYEERRVELRRMVKENWFKLYFVDRSTEVVDRTIATLDNLSRVTESRYGTGLALQQDVLKAQVERSKMEDMRISLQQRRHSFEAALNALLYRPADTPITVPSDLVVTPLALSAPELEELAMTNRPQLKALTAQVEKTQLNKRLAEREYYPDFTLALEYMQRDPAMGGKGYDMYSAGVTFNLPLQRDRREAKVAETEAETRMAGAELEMLRNEIRRAIADSLAQLERSRKLAELYSQGILPQATQSLEASLAAYRVGKAEFLNVLDSQMALFNFERDYYDAVADHQVRLAELEGTVGTPLPPVSPAPESGNAGTIHQNKDPQ